jgi:hypothetical protein
LPTPSWSGVKPVTFTKSVEDPRLFGIGTIIFRGTSLFQMQNRQILTHLFSLQQITNFSDDQDRSNGLFHADTQNYQAEHDAAWEARSLDTATGYGSENNAFASSSPPHHRRKKYQMQLRKFTSQDGAASISHQSASRELPSDSLEKICGGKTEKN